MIQAVGTDIVSISRIAKALERPGFAERILTAKELKRTLTPEYVAGRWAAKEAIKKCWPRIGSWHQVEITGQPGKAPEVLVHDPTFDPGHHRIHLSISHEAEFSVAFAVLESR